MLKKFGPAKTPHSEESIYTAEDFERAWRESIGFRDLGGFFNDLPQFISPC